MPEPSRIERAAKLLREGRACLILGGRLGTGRTLDTAGRIAAATGAKLLATFAFSRIERGAGLPRIDRIAYVTEQAMAQLAEFERIVLVGAPPPIAFFGHPTKPSVITKPGAEVFTLAEPDEDGHGAIAALAEALDATKTESQRTPRHRPDLPSGRIELAGLAAAVGALLPENAIVIDESVTSGRGMMGSTFGAPPHDWLVNTGGSIGIGIPMSVGAAVACPDRPVLCLEADGSGMYTVQALWTAAREGLAITVVLFANREYAILKGELASAIPNPGRRALDMLEIGRPDLDWVSLAKGMGVPARRVESLDDFATALRHGFASRAPNLIEVPL